MTERRVEQDRPGQLPRAIRLFSPDVPLWFGKMATLEVMRELIARSPTEQAVTLSRQYPALPVGLGYGRLEARSTGLWLASIDWNGDTRTHVIPYMWAVCSPHSGIKSADGSERIDGASIRLEARPERPRWRAEFFTGWGNDREPCRRCLAHAEYDITTGFATERAPAT